MRCEYAWDGRRKGKQGEVGRAGKVPYQDNREKIKERKE